MSANASIGGINAKVALDTNEFKRGMQEVGASLKKASNDFKNSATDINKSTKDSSNSIEKMADDTKKAEGSMSGSFGTMAATAGKAAVGIAALGAAAVGAAIIKGISTADELKKSLNGLQAATGSADKVMGDMKESMLELYNQNFGESFEDIGKSMATVAQQTGLVGPELTDLTKAALTMRDTFEFDVNESLRSAKMLSDQFGISGEKAYDLIAQGAQKGLDKNGDLLDTVNEYSVQFKGLGFSSEQMFNMLANGAANGTFSVDKLGDAVKEFGIRSKDGSKTSAEGFQALGLNAQDITAKFAAGGKTATDAFQLVTTKLIEMKDPVAQNAAGVALFGTQFEDLGIKGIAALTNMNGSISLSKNALEDINTVKYDSFGEAITGLGRQFETGLLLPVTDKVMPTLNQFANMINDNMPTIKQVISDAMDAVGKAFDYAFGIIKANLLPILNDLWTWIKPYIPQIQKTIQEAFDIVSKKVIPSLIDIFTTLTENVMPLVGDIFTWIVKNIMPPLVTVFKYIASELVPLLADQFKKWIPKISDIMKELWAFIKPILDALIAAFKAAWPAISTVISAAVKVIGTQIDIALSVIKGIIKFLTGVFTGDWKKAWDGIKGIFIDIWNSIKGLLGNQINTMKNIGKDIIDGLVNGIKGGMKAVTDAVSGITNAIPKRIKELLNISSPSKVTTELGKNIAEGLAKGMEEKADAVADKSRELSQKAIDAMNKLGDTTIDALKKKYEEEERLNINSLEKQNEDLKKASDKQLSIIDKTYRDKLKYIDAEQGGALGIKSAEIDAINAQTEAEEKAIVEKETASRIAKARAAVENEKDGAKKIELQDTLNALIAADERKKLLDARKARIEAIKVEMTDIKTKAEAQKEQALVEFNAATDHEKNITKIKTDSRNNEIVFLKEHYKGLMSEENLQAEARKLITNNNQTELMQLLRSYNPNWQNAGQSFGESLLQGLNSTKQSIGAAVNEMLALVSSSKAAANNTIIQSKSLYSAASKAGDKDLMAKAHEMAVQASASIGEIRGADGSIIGKIPSFASGVTNFAGGLARINEKGGEIVNLPNGSTVIPHDLSATTITINIENKGTVVGSKGMSEFADIVSKKISGKFGLSTGGAY
jgi:phage-related minor tail protein